MEAVKTLVKIEMSEELFRKYEEQAGGGLLPVEQIMETRLRHCVDHTSVRGLCFNDQSRRNLEQITGHLLKSPEDAVASLKQMTTLKVGGVSIKLSQDILRRAESRAASFRMPLEEWLQREITIGLETAVGLRG